MADATSNGESWKASETATHADAISEAFQLSPFDVASAIKAFAR